MIPPPPSFEAALVHTLLLRDELLDAFERAWRPWPPMTLALTLCLLAVHAAVGWLDGRLRGLSALAMAFGARGAEALTQAGGRDLDLLQEGERWRLLSCVFLHGDALHLAFNALALLALGRVIEALHGPWTLLALFLGSGLAGSLMSSAAGTPLSVGASGAIFGLMGAALGFGLTRREVLPRPLRPFLGWGLLPLLALNLGVGGVLVVGVGWLGWRLPELDQAAHLGGLLAGLAFGLVAPARVVPWEDEGWALRRLPAPLSALALAWMAWGLAGQG